MQLTGQHPLSVYFQNENEEEEPEAQKSPPQPMVGSVSPKSFGYDRGDPLSVNTDPEFGQSPAAQEYSNREDELGHHYSGI